MNKLNELIGNTPLVEVQNIFQKDGVKLYGKLEGNNPGGSVKDRAAYGMISGAIERGDVKAGDKLVEATSGNTGIALAMIAQIFGLKMTLIMPESATRERVLTMKAYGAEVILTPADKTIEYSRKLAQDMSEEQIIICLISLPILITMGCTIAPLAPKSGEIPSRQ